jgi:hypothetical protein
MPTEKLICQKIKQLVSDSSISAQDQIELIK